MAAKTARLGDVGTTFEAQALDCGVALDISSATTLEIFFKGPTGVATTKTAVFTTDGTDGKLEYLTLAGDLDEVGRWSWQPHAVLPGKDWKGEKKYFQVESVLV